MKHILCAAALLLTATLGHAADEGKSVPYTATVTGVVCSSCKAHITEAIKKLPGADAIHITKGEKEGTQTVTFNASSPTLAKEDVVKSLGKDAARYEVLALEKAAN